ncbi:amino acid ABC transporter permease [Alicyclobacillus fodiniaquatilis]|uniref:Amino acid ABC transporter permease n=1 Tax=Alicyclobacillus fodiniaquatilis TaxID=1661150 RepID=A0ABW4JM99_9BACL
MNLDFGAIVPDIPFILGGVLVTLEFTLISTVFGFILGTLLSIIKISKFAPLRWFGVAYTSVFRGTPLLVQLTFIYFAVPQLTGYDIPALQAGVIAFSLNSAAYVSEVIRAGILAVPKGQRDAALSLGIPNSKIMKDIILPQAVKNILPALVNEGIALLKDSTLVSAIAANDLLRRAEITMSNTFRYFEPLILIAAIYYVLVMALTVIGQRLERRLRRSD